MLLRALGFSTNTDIFNAFGSTKIINPKKDDLNSYVGATITEDIVDTRTGEIFLEGGSEITADNIDSLKDSGIQEVMVIDSNKDFHSMLLLNTIEKDPTNNTEEALGVVYQLIRSSEPPNLETAQKFIERIFLRKIYMRDDRINHFSKENHDITVIDVDANKCQKIVNHIDSSHMNTYDKLRNSRGFGVAALIDSCCGSCYSTLPPQTVVEIKSNNVVLSCPSCSVYMYWEEEETEE